ncbi:MAG TPA: low temperature requirement protein A [Gaiellaceae bacterium]|nr:low temperature requirement protein A [Gaiellaceae bacterium]
MIRGLRGFGIAPAHFVERHGLVVIVAIGESVVAVGIGASHLPVDGALVLAAALGLALSACLWWLYFGGDDERAVRALAGMDPVRRARGALVGYGYAHLPLLLGIVTIASAKRRGFEHPFTTFSWTRAAILGGGGQHLPRGRRPLAEGAGARARRSTDGGDSPRPRDGSARRDRLPRRPDRRARRAPRPRDRSGERMDMTDAHALTSHLVLFSHLGLTHPNRTRLRCGDNVALSPHLGLTHPNRA